MRIPSGVTDQVIYFVAVDATDLKTRETGLSSFTVYRSRNGGTVTAMTTPTVTELDATNMPGVYKLLLDEDMTIDSGDDSQEMCFHITQASMAPVTRVIELYRPKITAGETLTVSSGAVSTVSSVTAFAGTITTLDALDTAQDSQHATTQAAISALNDPTAAAIADAVWDEATSGHVTAGSFGVAVTDTLADTADIQPKLGTVSDLGGGATIAANLSDVAGATFSTATDSLAAIRDRGDAAWTTGAGGSDRLLMVDTTIATLASQTSFTLTAGSADNDAYNGCTIVIEDASTSTQKAVGIVDDYVGSTRTVTLLQDPGIFTMAATDKVYILAERALKPTAQQDYHVDVTSGGNVGIDWGNVANPTTAVDLSATDIQLCDTVTTNSDLVTAAAIRAEIDSNSTQLAAIVADTNELQTDWANGGRLDLIIDAILVDTGTTIPAVLGTPVADLATDIATMDAVADAILVDTGTTLPATLATLATPAQVNAQVLDVVNADTLVAGVTMAEALRRIGAITSGVLSGAGTGTETITDYAGSGSTIVVTVDGSGNRSGITYN